MEDFNQNSFFKYLFNKSQEVQISEVKDNKYINNLFEITFDIPNNWHVVSMATFNEVAAQQTIKRSFEVFKSEILDTIGYPSCFLTKHDPNSTEHDGVISPTINFSIISKDKDYLNMSLSQYANLLDQDEEETMLTDFKIVTKGEVYERDGYDYIQFDTEYLFEHPDLDQGVKVEMSVLNIDYYDFYLDFSMTQCEVQGEIAENEFKTFVNSIKLKKKV